MTASGGTTVVSNECTYGFGRHIHTENIDERDHQSFHHLVRFKRLLARLQLNRNQNIQHSTGHWRSDISIHCIDRQTTATTERKISPRLIIVAASSRLFLVSGSLTVVSLVFLLGMIIGWYDGVDASRNQDFLVGTWIAWRGYG